MRSTQFRASSATLFFLVIASLSVNAHAAGNAAAGDAAAGQTKAAVCSACHGMDGNSVNPEWPSLAGQHESYTASQLDAFQSGARQNVLMTPMSMGLSDQDKADIAAYYSAKTITVTAVDPALADLGQKLYRTGDKERGIAACTACHGPAGRGNEPAGMPSISGQKTTYLVSQLRAYADGTRAGATDTKTSMMHDVATLLSAEDMAALASFVQGLK